MFYIKKNKLNNFLSDLENFFDVFDMRKHILPFKKYLLPPDLEVLSSDENGNISVPEISKDFIIFGLSLPDLEALLQLDDIMSKPNEDFYYWSRRNRSTIIGLTTENAGVNFGGDIILESLSDGNFRAFVHTEKGKKLARRFKKYFLNKKGDEEETEEPNEDQNWSEKMQKLLLDSELLAKAVEWSKDYKIWDELAEKCLGCGICAYVCPICYCFSMEDRVGLDGKCSRCRKWDACTLPEFSKIAGGHSFRPTIKERYYNWFFHKFVRAYNEYGKSQCVGCGRCKRFCPAGIDIYEVLQEILREYNRVNEIKNY